MKVSPVLRALLSNRMAEMDMNRDGFYHSMLQDMRGINMSERERARAEDGVRKSAALVNLLVGMAGFVGVGEKQDKKVA